MALPTARRASVVLLGTAVLCAWCGWASGLRHSTAAAFAAFSATIAAVATADVLSSRIGRRRGRQPSRFPARVLPTMFPWLALFVAAAGWEALGIDTGRHVPHLTVSALAQAFRPFNAGLWLTWIVVGLAYGAACARVPPDSARPGALRDSPPSATGGVAGSGCVSGILGLLLPASRAVGVGFWLGWVAVCAILELVAHRSRGRLATFEDVVRFLRRPRLARPALVAAWAYTGWHLFAH